MIVSGIDTDLAANPLTIMIRSWPASTSVTRPDWLARPVKSTGAAGVAPLLDRLTWRCRHPARLRGPPHRARLTPLAMIVMAFVAVSLTKSITILVASPLARGHAGKFAKSRPERLSRCDREGFGTDFGANPLTIMVKGRWAERQSGG
jgi:hypothetical protein